MHINVTTDLPFQLSQFPIRYYFQHRKKYTVTKVSVSCLGVAKGHEFCLKKVHIHEVGHFHTLNRQNTKICINVIFLILASFKEKRINKAKLIKTSNTLIACPTQAG